MSKVVPGRFSAQIDESFVVFLIGMRVNNIWAVNKWLPTAQAMSPMLSALHQYPDKGFLGQESFFLLFPLFVCRKETARQRLGGGNQPAITS